MDTSEAVKPSAAGFKAGLEDIVVASSSICFIDGKEGRLVYRGYDITDLAANSSFAETAFLLWYGHLPKKAEFDIFQSSLRDAVKLPTKTVQIMQLFPNTATPMEVLRTAVSSMGHWDPDSGNTTIEACLRKAMRLTSRIGEIITAHDRLRRGLEPVAPIPGESLAYNFLYTLSGEKPRPEFVKALDVALILHADHEFNASTFAGRVVAATMSDIYSCVTASIGALKGPLHGGANEQVFKMLTEIGEVKNAEEWIKKALANKVKIPGFGHRVYRTEDPRATILRKYSEELGKLTGDTKWYEMSRVVETAVRANTKVYPNVDFYSASCYHVMGIPTELFTPLFAVSRIVGWTAHVFEQWGNNRLIRPRAEYTGPARLSYIPLEKR